MKVLLVLCVLLGATMVSAAADEAVVTLTEKDFDDFVKNTKLALIEFYAPWCGHCKALAPEYEKAAQELKGKDSGVLAKVDCTTDREVCNKFEVQGFPTIKVFRNDGSTPADYDGPRKADGIVKFLARQSAPSVSELADVAAVKGFAPSDNIKIVAFVAANGDIAGYTSTASALRNEFSFGVVKGNDAANTEYKVTAPAVVMFRDFDDGAVTYTGDVNDKDALTSFIRAQSFPLVGEIGPENYAKYLERGFNFVWVFIDMDSDKQKQLIEDITPVAKDFRNKLSFVKLDGVKWAEHAKSFGLSGNTPGLVIEDRQKRKNFVWSEDKPLTAGDLKPWVQGVLDGTIQPNVKSEPIPEKNDGPVKVIVGHTYSDIVNDDSKDVLVEFYAPWCGHCKALTPKYEELGKMFADDPTVVIAKVDATANDTPAEIQGFPTIILYPAGDKSNGVPYEGERTAKGMFAFVNANGKANGRPKQVEGGAGGEEEHEGHDHGDHDHDHGHEEL
jgi:protein disulfide-isomerase A1